MIATKLAVNPEERLPSQLAATHGTMAHMTTKTEAADKATWLRKLDRATATHEKTRAALEDVVADARTVGVPLITIAKHTPWSREWCRKIADRIDEERAAAGEHSPPATSSVANPNRIHSQD